MGKIGLIIQREFTTRVKKKSFIIMTILAPVLIAGMMTAILYAAINKNEKQVIEVVDDTGLFEKFLEDSKNFTYRRNYNSKPAASADLYKKDYNTILWIPNNFPYGGIQIISKEQPSTGTTFALKKQLRYVMEDNALYEKCKVTRKDIKAGIPDFGVISKKQKEDGTEEEKSEVGSYIIGMVLSLVIYMFIFMYGVQVMRGVIEEKTNRIVEILASSIKPVQLMFGKIIGIGLVSLTQFLVWGILGAILTSIGTFAVTKASGLSPEQMEAFNPTGMQAPQMNDVAGAQFFAYIGHVDLLGIFTSFLVFFIGGYLLYSAIFGAIGAAVDNETDTQQFMLPVSLPLIGSIVLSMSFVMNDPNGLLSKVISIFPLTSPIAMMVRLPYGVPPWELYLSMGLLIITAIGVTILAARVYKAGILLYGRKPTFKDMFKWMRKAR